MYTFKSTDVKSGNYCTLRQSAHAHLQSSVLTSKRVDRNRVIIKCICDTYSPSARVRVLAHLRLILQA